MDRNDSHQPAGDPSAEVMPMHQQDATVVPEGTVEPSIGYQPPVYPMDELTGTPPQQWMDKVPGDLEQLQRLVSTLSGTASNIGEQVGRLKSVSVDTFWSGDAAKAFTEYKDELPPPLDLAQKRYHGTAHALRTYTTALHDIKQTGRRAVQEATEAKHYIETHGHHVAEWRMYTHDGPIYLPMPLPVPEPLPHPLPDPGPEPVYHPGNADGARVLASGTSAQRVPQPGIEPARPAVLQGPQPTPPELLAEFERFGASVKLMESAIDRYDDAAKKCAAAISTAIDDDLKNTAGYGKSLGTLKDKLSTNLAAIAPQLQGQLGRITGVAGLLGWLPMIAAFAGKDPQAKKTLAQLSKEAEQWKAASGDGKQIVDGFLKLLTANTDAAGQGTAGSGGTAHTGHTGQTEHTWTPPKTPDVWHIGADDPGKVTPGATAVEGTIQPDTPARVAEGTIQPDTPAQVATPAGSSNFSFDAGGATVNISITAPESMSQIATHTVPVPAGV